jgi:hypothetical protein
MLEARYEDCSESIKKTLDTGMQGMLSMFEKGVQSEEGRKQLPDLCRNFLLNVMQDAVKDNGSVSAPLDNMAEFVETVASKLADPAGKWKDGVESVTVDGASASSLSEIKLGLGIPEEISLKDALARRKASMASKPDGSGSAPKMS